MPQLYNPEHTPAQNAETLKANPYPGRLLVMGYAGGVAVQAYAIMGRREGSRNRIFVEEDGIVSTEVFDTSAQTGDPALTIYDAMRRRGSTHVVSNGDQTSTVMQHLRSGSTFEKAMEDRVYEPDEPHYTPRISGYIDTDDLQDTRFGISIIRKKTPRYDWPVRKLFTEHSPEITLESGVGYSVHTYKGDGNPLPTYDERPFTMPVEDTAESMAQLLWDSLDDENRVSVAAKVFTPTSQEVHIINGHQR